MFCFWSHLSSPSVELHASNDGLWLVFSVMYMCKEILFCTFGSLQWIVTDCVRSDTTPLKITTVLTGALCLECQDTDASVTETRINWTRWKRVPNFKPLSCTSKAPFFKILCTKSSLKLCLVCVWRMSESVSLSRIVLHWTVCVEFNRNFSVYTPGLCTP